MKHFLLKSFLIHNICLLLLICLTYYGASAKPYIPKDDSEILEKLPTKGNQKLSKELQKLKKDLEDNPKDEKSAINFAKQCIEIARDKSDPRFFGYAEAALKPWLNRLDTSTQVQTLNAIIKQSNHNFKGALEDLSQVLKKDPTNAQAWITKAQIHTTLGEYDKAKQSCTYLLSLVNKLTSITCISIAGSLSDSAEKSYTLLNQVFDEARNLDTINLEEKLWALITLGDIAARLGNNNIARDHFNEVLKFNPNNSYLLAVYSDLLLNENKPSEVISLLKDKNLNDALLVKLAIAEKKLNLSDLNKHTADLKARFAANKLRGDKVHLREEAIFLLELLNNTKDALKLASENWKIQKEPQDARILLKAAIKCNNKNAAMPVINFLKKNKLEDVQLEKLIRKAEGNKQ